MKKLLFIAMTIVSLCGYAQPLVETFEQPWVSPGLNLPPAPPGWSVVNEWGPTITWQQSAGAEPGPPYGGNNAAFLGKENVVSSDNTPKDWLISPAFQIPAVPGTIEFYSRLTIAGDQGGVYKVYLGNDPTNLASFTEIYSATEEEMNPVQTEYTLKTINIPPAFGGLFTRVAFVMIGDDTDRWLIDNVSILSECPAPSQLTATNITATSAHLGWTESGIATQWEIQVIPPDAVPTGIGVVVNDNSYMLSNLIEGNYKFYVRSVCGAQSMSSWSGPYYFSISSCLAPTNVAVSSPGLNSVTYTWTPTDAASYDYWYTTTNAIPNASTIPSGNIPTATATIAPIVPGQNYKFYVRANCGGGNVSPWSGIPESPAPAGNLIHGTVLYDSNADGICNADDNPLAYTEVQLTENDLSFSVYTDQNGQYILSGFADGTHTLSLHVVSPVFGTIAPLVQQVTFNAEVNDVHVNHCLGQPNAVNDLEVVVAAATAARPGFDATYQVIVHNSGSQLIEDAVVNMSFDNSRITYVGSNFSGVTPATASLSIPVGDVQPFSVVSGTITFHVMQPPTNIGGEILHFNAVLSDVPNDATPDNNDAVLNQIIVNGFDPNDMTVHEGAKIYEDQADDYLTYTIRFQNTGNGDAINIRLENTLDPLLDWNTFQPVVSSHNYTVKRIENELEFLYPEINLPPESANEPGSHGFVTYKIKPKAEYGLADIISNKGDIYFDFNPVIETNTATTEVITLVGFDENAIAVARLYPNPVKDRLHVEVGQGELQLVTIHDINGRLCLSANAGTIDTNALTAGIYFVKVTTDAGSANYKIIKH